MNLAKTSSPVILLETEPESSFRTTTLFHKFIYTCLFLIASLFIYSLFHRGLHMDEAVLGEHAYWLAKIGKVKANLYAGTGVGWEDELLVYHKLFIWSGAGIISLFGLSLPILRLFIFIFAVVLCLLIYRYCRNFLQLPPRSTKTIFLLSLLLLFVNSFFFAYSYIFRPEIMQACLGFGSFYALSAYLQKGQTKNLLLAALLAGLAALTHLNGLIFMGAGAIILLINNKYKPAFIFAGASTVVTLFYLINMIGDPESWELFIWQFKGDPAIEEEDLSIADRVVRVFLEHKRYFHSQVEGSFTVLFLLALLVNGKYLWHNHRTLLLYPFLCAFFLACISQGMTSKYALLFLPQATLVMAISIQRFYSRPQSKKMIWAGGVVFLLYAGIQFHNSFSLYVDGEALEERNARIARHIPKNSHVYASIPFFFNEVENYRISSLIAFELLAHRYYKLRITKEDFFKHVRSLNSQYIIIDLLKKDNAFLIVLEQLKKEGFSLGETYGGFKVIRYQDDYIIMKRQ